MAISKALLSCDGTARTSSKRSARRIAGVAALAFLVAATLGSSIVLAGNRVGSFEIDGNLAPDYSAPPPEPIDWLSNPFPASLTTFHDATGQGDNIFGMGSKENDQSSWVCTTGSAPQKDDVLDQISILQSSSPIAGEIARSEEHTSELQSLAYLVCRLLLEKKNAQNAQHASQQHKSTTRIPSTTSNTNH